MGSYSVVPRNRAKWEQESGGNRLCKDHGEAQRTCYWPGWPFLPILAAKPIQAFVGIRASGRAKARALHNSAGQSREASCLLWGSKYRWEEGRHQGLGKQGHAPKETRRSRVFSIGGLK